MAKDKENVAVADPEPTGLDAEPVAGVTEGALYGLTSGTPKVDEKPDAKADEKPAKDAKADTKPPAKADAKAKPEPDAAAEAAAAEQKRWDEERQRRDQAHANERAALNNQIDLMKDQVTAMQAQIALAAKTETEDKAGKERMAVAERLQSQLVGLGAESDPGELTLALRTMGGLVADLLAKPSPSSPIDASAVQEIQDRIAKMEDSNKRLSDEIASQAAQANLERTLQKLDAEFGPEHRNGAIKEAREMLGAYGRTGDNPPTSVETELVLRNAYMKRSAGDKKPSPMPDGKAGVLPGDTGAGGSATETPLGPSGSIEDVLADMQRKGQVR